MLKTANDDFITINNIELGGRGESDKFVWQILQKCKVCQDFGRRL